MNRKPTYEEMRTRVRTLTAEADALREEVERLRRLFREARRTEKLYHSLIHSSADAIVI